MITICNRNILGYRSLCGPDDPRYLMYIDDLNGINLLTAAKIAEISGRELIHRAIRSANTKLMNDVLFYNKKGSTPIVSTRPTTELFREKSFTTIKHDPTGEPTPDYRGIEFTLDSNCNKKGKYNYSELIIRNIYLKVDEAVSTTIYVLADDEPLESYDVDLVAGQKYKLPDLYLRTGATDIKIVFDQSTLTTYQSNIKEEKSICAATCKNTGFNICKSGLVNAIGGFGVTADVDLACDIEKVWCDLLPYFSEELRYGVGVYLVNEASVTSEMNFFTINNIEDLQALAGTWNGLYWDGVKAKAPNLRKVVQGNDCNCFENTFIKTTYNYV